MRNIYSVFGLHRYKYIVLYMPVMQCRLDSCVLIFDTLYVIVYELLQQIT